MCDHTEIPKEHRACRVRCSKARVYSRPCCRDMVENKMITFWNFQSSMHGVQVSEVKNSKILPVTTQDILREKINLDELNCTCASLVPIGPRLLPKIGTPAATCAPRYFYPCLRFSSEILGWSDTREKNPKNTPFVFGLRTVK